MADINFPVDTGCGRENFLLSDETKSAEVDLSEFLPFSYLIA